MTNRILTFITLLFMVFSLPAFGALSGTYTINPSGTASATVYLNLTSAISDLTSGTRGDGGTPNGAGVSGAVILELAGIYISTGETFPLTFAAITGTSSTNTITIRPAAGVSSALSITSANATATIDLSGCTYVVFDGRPGGTGSNKYITIDNTNTSGVALRYINDASNNTVKYCTLSGVNTSTSSGVVLFSTTTGTTGNDNNTIDNCAIRDGSSTPTNCIFSFGTISKANSGNIVSNCTVYNFFAGGASSSGINISSNNDSWTITGNHLFQTSSRTGIAGWTHTGISIQSGINGNTNIISGNYIGGGAENAGGSAWTMTGAAANRFIGIDLNVGTTTATSVQGNTIANFSWSTISSATTSNGIWCGINITGGNVNVGTTTGNTIGNSSTGSVSVTTSSTGGTVMGMNVSGSVVVNISNNNIGSITANGSSTSVSCSINGIVSTASGTLTISGNTIGHASTANSLNAVTSSTSGTGQQVTGINHSTGAATISITNNTIANLNNNYAGTATAGQMRGIFSAAGVNTITGNTIRNLSTTSASSGATTTSSVIGISFTSTSTAGSQSVSQNVIHTIANTTATASVAVIGIYATGPSSGTHVMSRNLIHSLHISSTSTASILAGIQVGGGTGITYQNNMIRVGIDASGNSITNGFAVYGIYQSSGTNINFYHNSVYVGGTGVSAAVHTAAFYRAQTSAAVNLINNILVNARSNSSGSFFNAAIRIGNTTDYTTPFMVSNNNILHAPGTGGVIGLMTNTEYTSLASWQTTTNMDLSSGAGSPGFVNASGNASTVDLHISGTTPAEGYGNNSTGVTDDYDGSTRSGLTAVDIGADAGNYTAIDVFSPSIAYTPFTANTANTSNRALTATITDIGSGLPTSGGNRPRIWFRRSAPSVSSWASTVGTLNTGTGNSGTWSFTIDYSVLSITPASGDTFQYYIVAQDQAGTPNLGYSPVAGTSHTNVNTQTTAPTAPTSYAIVTSTLGTSINVGTGQTFTSLTGSGGLFAAINSSALTGNTIVSITSNLTEDGTNALTGAGLSGYTLTIQPSAASVRTISNSADLSVSMLRFDGVSGVTVDGRSGGSGQYFRIINTHTAFNNCKAAVEVLGSSTNSTLRNCIIETNASTNTLGNVLLNTGANTGIIIRNNDIRDAQGTPGTAGIPANLIFSASINNVTTVQDNNWYNFTNNAINLNSAGDACTISGNSVYYNASTTPSAAQVGILVGSGNNHTISANYVGGQSANCGGSAWTNSGNITFSGIQLLGGNIAASSIQGNTVQNISLTGTGGVNFNGILVSAGMANVGTVTGNLIGHATTANSISNTGSTNSGTSVTIGIGTASTSTTTISNNTIANITASTSASTTSVGVRGISNTGSGQCTISGNTIYSISANAATTGAQAAPVGILTNSANTSQLITANTIYNLSNTNTTAVTPSLHGICTNQSSSGGTISRNRIYGLTNTTTGTTPTLNGIFINAGTSWIVVNNQISLTNGSNTNSIVVTGIRDGSSGSHNFYYNSIYIGGSVSAGSINSYGFLRSLTANVSLRNNLLYNERSGGTGGYYAIGNINGTPATNWSSGASNYNLFVVPSLSAAGEWGSGTAQTLAQFQTSSGGEANSAVQLNSTIPSSTFFTGVGSSPVNLSIQSGSQVYVKDLGIPIPSITTDYDGNSRPVSITSIGAFEYSTLSTPIANNTISTDQTVCSGSNPAALTGALPTGGNGTFTYTWLSSTTSATSGFAAATGTNNTQNYSPSALTQNTWFRRYVVSGAETDTSSAVLITVNAPVATNTASGVQTICSGSTPTALTGSTPTGGTGTFTYAWLSSTTSASSGFAAASGTNNTQNYTPGALTQNTWYKRRVSSGACNADTSAAVAITVNPVIAGNTIGSNQTIFINTTPTPITGALPTGGSGSYTYSWISSTTSSTTGFAAASGTNNTQNYTPGALALTTYYRRIVLSGGCADTSSAITVTVQALPPPGNCLDLDGNNDYARASNIVLAQPYTVEGWFMLKSGRSCSRLIAADNNELLIDDNNAQNTLRLYVNLNTVLSAPNAFTNDTWFHAAFVVNGSSSKIYVNGVDVTASGSLDNSGLNATNFDFGYTGTAGQCPMKGKMDEIRIWSNARTQSQIQTNMLNIVPSNTSGLFAYYNFDNGTAGGTNTGLTTLEDKTSGGKNATLQNFALSGSTSNWIESYAMVVPTLAAPSGITASSFTANWNAPAIGVVDTFLLDVSSNRTFSAPVTGSPFKILSPTTTYTVSGGLSSGTKYYYRLRADKINVTSQGAPSLVDSVTLTVSALNNNTISSAQTICSGSTPTALTGSTPTGGTGIFTYTWLSSTTSATAGFTAATGTNNTQNYSPSALTQNTWFRRYVVSGAATDTSSAVLITVNAPVATNTASGNQTICSGSTPTVLTGSTPTGGTGTFTYTWLSSTTSSTAGFTAATGTNNTQNYTPAALTANTWYRRRVTSGVCNADTSAAVAITVNAPVATNTASGAQTICSGSTPTALTGSTPTGGTGTFTYTWLSSTASATAGFTAATGTNNTQNYTPAALTANTWYRRRVTSGVCNADTSTAVAITVNDPVATNTASGTQTICSGSTPTALTGSTPTGGTGTFTYTWLSSTTSATAGFTAATGTNNTQNYTPAALTANTWYRRRVTSGVCNADTSAAVAITVNAPVATNTASGAQTICSGSTPTVLTGSAPTGGTGTFIYTWLSSATSATAGFAAATGTNNTQNYTPGALTQNTWYKRRVSSGVCNADTSAAVMITINSPVNISGQPVNTFACADSSGFVVTASGGSLSYQWQIKSGNVWTDISVSDPNYPGNSTNMMSAKGFGIPLAPNAYSNYFKGYYRCRVANTCTTSFTDSVFMITYTNVWTGSANNSWNNPANWLCGSLPNHNVLIPATAPNSPVLSGNQSVNFITLETGKSLSMNSNNDSLTINGDILGSGANNFNASKGTTIFNNSSFPQTVPAGTYYNLAVQSNGFGVTGGVITVKNRITSTVPVRTGSELIIDTNATYAVTLIKTESPAGKLTIRNIGTGGRTGSVLFPVGNGTSNPVTIANTGTADAFSVYVLDSVTNAYSGSTPTGAKVTANAVNHTWMINEGTPGGSNATVTLQWPAGDELAGFNRASSYVSKYTGSTWLPVVATAASGSNPYSQTRTNINTFGPFGVGSGGTLPVELISFHAVKQSRAALLVWETASELNNDRFEVERSSDGKLFAYIQTVKGNGTTNNKSTYQLLDEEAQTAATNSGSSAVYYRLKQVDMDGSVTYSETRMVNMSNGVKFAQVQPNPYSSNASVVLQATASGKAEIVVTDIKGSIITSQSENLIEGYNEMELKGINNLKAGMYFVTIKQDDEVNVLKLMRKD